MFKNFLTCIEYGNEVKDVPKEKESHSLSHTLHTNVCPFFDYYVRSDNFPSCYLSSQVMLITISLNSYWFTQSPDKNQLQAFRSSSLSVCVCVCMCAPRKCLMLAWLVSPFLLHLCLYHVISASHHAVYCFYFAIHQTILLNWVVVMDFLSFFLLLNWRDFYE